MKVKVIDENGTVHWVPEEVLRGGSTQASGERHVHLHIHVHGLESLFAAGGSTTRGRAGHTGYGYDDALAYGMSYGSGSRAGYSGYGLGYGGSARKRSASKRSTAVKGKAKRR